MNLITINRLRKFLVTYYFQFFMSVGLLFVAINLIVRFSIIGSYTHINTAQIESNINNSFSQAVSLSEQWVESDNDSIFISNLWKIETPQNWNDHLLSFLLYKGDSLMLWSNYTFIDAEFNALNTIIPTDSMLVLTEDKLLIQRKSKADKVAVVILNLDNYEGVNPYIFSDINLKILTPNQAAGKEHALSVYNGSFYVQPGIELRMPSGVAALGWLGLLFIVIGLQRIFRRLTKQKNAFIINFLFLMVLVGIGSLFTISELPINSNRIFETIVFSVGNIDVSIGKLLINFILLLIYTLYLHRIRYKLAYCYRKKSVWRKRMLILGILLFINFAVVFFHYSMVTVIYHTDINTELYKFTLIDSATLVFYLICACFVVFRILVNIVVRTIFYDISSWLMLLISVALLALLLLPVENVISNTGYILLIFNTFFLLTTIWEKKNSDGKLGFIGLIAVFTIYIVLFATIESNIAESRNSKIYAQAVVYQNKSVDELDDKYQKLTYYRIVDNHIDVKNNNSIDLQQLSSVLELGVDTTVTLGGYEHYVYHARNRQTVVVSRHAINGLDYLSFFAYVFITLYLSAGVVFKFANYRHILKIKGSRFAMRIRFVVIGVVLFTMTLVVVVITVNTFNNYDINSRNTINRELQVLIHSFEQYAKGASVSDSVLLQKWFTTTGVVKDKDVLIYNAKGEYITSSIRPNAYSRVNAGAYSALFWNRAPFYNRNTYYENTTFNSAYVPVMHNNQLLGFMNLVQLNRVNGLVNDPRYDVLENIFNVLIIVLLIAVILSMLLYRTLTMPLGRLYHGMGNIAALRKIEGGDSDDEISLLIRQYNKMIDYLEESYAALARSEREGAWREMARQVAHEIKNPLTPMRLKIQMLQRAKQRNEAGWSDRIDGTLNTLIEQIDLLAKIASEFSNFARIGETRFEKVNVSELLGNMQELYSNHENVNYQVMLSDVDLTVLADRSQLQRVLLNLSQNAVQALMGRDNPCVIISAERMDNNVVIKVTDNGCGISDEACKKIFEPNFTTKSSGSGLGLAMSKQIIVNTGGTIMFETTENVGTTFIVTLPLAEVAP